jgi:DASH complex subunit DAD3
LAANPSPDILDALRGLERKTSLVFTLLKASVYSIVLNLQMNEDENEGQDQGHNEGDTTI